jgi:hypothetical protein
MTFVALETRRGRRQSGWGGGRCQPCRAGGPGAAWSTAARDRLADRRQVALEVAARLSGPVVTPVVQGGLSTPPRLPGTVTVPSGPTAHSSRLSRGTRTHGDREDPLFSWHGGNFSFVKGFVDGWRGGAQLAGMPSESLHQADDGSRSGERCRCRKQTYMPGARDKHDAGRVPGSSNRSTG